jgi:hypothetical protein
MYQPYPGGNYNPYVRRPPAPPSVQTAVKFMYAGAASSLISILVSLNAVSGIKRVIGQSSAPVPASQLNDLVGALVGALIVIGLIGAGIWLWLARFCLRGRNWARITGTVLFALSTLNALGSLGFSGLGLARLDGLFGWLIGLCAVIYLWRPDSTAFFKAPPA